MRNLVNRRPPLPAGLTATSALAPLFAELDRLHNDGLGHRHEIEALASDQKVAREDARIAAAVALRAGKPDPGDRHGLELAQRASAIHRKVAQIADVRTLVVRDVEQLLEANGESWALEAEGRIRQAQLDADAALGAFLASRQLMADLQASARWLSSAGQAKPVAFLGDVPGLISRNGRAFGLAEVVAALQAIDTEADAPSRDSADDVDDDALDSADDAIEEAEAVLA